MNKYNSNIDSIYSLISTIDIQNLKPIYFLFGEDYFTISNSIKIIEQKVMPLISSDFDRETISADKKSSLTEIIDLAYTFPFGSEKKLLIVKNFENLSNKKSLVDYINSPSESTILVLANYGQISSFRSEPYQSLSDNNFLFEARELKGAELNNWVKKRCKQLGFEINHDDISLFIDIVGEDKSLIDMQLQKFKSFLGDKQLINSSEIQKLSAVTKEYSIFDLLNSIGKGKLNDSLKVLNNLLGQNKDLVFIINMLTKYFSTISQALELQSRNLSDFDASKALGVSKYYYINCKNAHFFRDSKRLYSAFKALYDIDLTIKTTAIEQKTLAILLLTNILAKK